MSTDSIRVFKYVKEHEEENIIASDIAEALFPGVEATRKVNGIITAAFQRYKNKDKEIIPLMKRVEGEIEIDGKHKSVKFIKLTEQGRAFDIDNIDVSD